MEKWTRIFLILRKDWKKMLAHTTTTAHRPGMQRTRITRKGKRKKKGERTVTCFLPYIRKGSISCKSFVTRTRKCLSPSVHSLISEHMSPFLFLFMSINTRQTAVIVAWLNRYWEILILLLYWSLYSPPPTSADRLHSKYFSKLFYFTHSLSLAVRYNREEGNESLLCFSKPPGTKQVVICNHHTWHTFHRSKDLHVIVALFVLLANHPRAASKVAP